MAFPLGVAIANLFARIAAALQGQAAGSISPLPPSGGGGTHVPPPSGGGGSTTPIPEPPQTPTSPPVYTPPPVVEVPPVVPVTPPPASSPDPCLLSLSDRIALSVLASNGEQPQSTSLSPYIFQPVQEDVTSQSINVGTLLTNEDMFRFRAYSTSVAVTVSFFGRMERYNRDLVPFMHQLTTTTAGTIYETIVPTGAGYLLGAAASVPIGSITAGNVTAIGEIGLMNGGTFIPHTLLFSGQLSDQQPLSSTLANPATPASQVTFKAIQESAWSGSDSQTTITPTAGKKIRICHIDAGYTNSAVAGNRQWLVRLRNTAMTLFEGLPDQYTTASQATSLRASIWGNPGSQSAALPAASREISIPLPPDLYFWTDTIVLLSVYGQQAGDTFSQGFIRYEES